MSDIVRMCALQQEYSLRLLHLKKRRGINNCFGLVSPVHIVLLWNVVRLTESMYKFTNVLIKKKRSCFFAPCPAQYMSGYYTRRGKTNK